jgi:transcriptional regulator of acetoin/glycerol metabolism
VRELENARARFSEGRSETKDYAHYGPGEASHSGSVEKLNGDKLMAAKLLGIGKTTLYRRLKEYGHPQV